jgi:hypothetical protein
MFLKIRIKDKEKIGYATFFTKVFIVIYKYE